MATFYVETLWDFNHKEAPERLSLREAILAANALGGTNTIILSGDRDLNDHYLDIEGTDENLGLTGDLDITNGTLNIEVEGTGLVTLDARDLDRIFHVHDGATLNLSNVSIFDGHADTGGAIYVEAGGEANLENIHFYRNEAQSGGAIYVEAGGSATLEGIFLQENRANLSGGTFSGGGIYNAGNLLMSNVFAIRNFAASGAGIYNSGTADLEEVTFLDNNTNIRGQENRGGAIYVTPTGSLTLRNSELNDNQVVGGDGGGIYNSGSLRIEETLIKTNRASNGGGGLFNNSSATVELVNTTFERNLGIAAKDTDYSKDIHNLGILQVQPFDTNVFYQIGQELFLATDDGGEIRVEEQKAMVHGGDGDELIELGSTDDVLWGGRGNNTLSGGEGQDIFVLKPGGHNVITDFTPGVDAIAFISGWTFEDLTMNSVDGGLELVLTNTGEVLAWFDGVSELREADFLPATGGGLGANYFLSGGKRDDLLDGGDGNDVFFGRQGNDVLNGGEGVDHLYGNGGEDSLFGGDGEDFLSGGKGNDFLAGGQGRDIFVVTPGLGTDTLDDFTNGEDLIRLGGGLTFEQLDVTDHGGDTYLGYQGKELAILSGVTASQIHEADFALFGG